MSPRNRKKVRCPNRCLLRTKHGKSREVFRYFEWINGDMGTMRYCENCGSELEVLYETFSFKRNSA